MDGQLDPLSPAGLLNGLPSGPQLEDSEPAPRLAEGLAEVPVDERHHWPGSRVVGWETLMRRTYQAWSMHVRLQTWMAALRCGNGCLPERGAGRLHAT